jgi:hypothetical protein
MSMVGKRGCRAKDHNKQRPQAESKSAAFGGGGHDRYWAY